MVSVPKSGARSRSGPDLVAGLATGVLLVSLFLPWFGVSIGAVGLNVSGLRFHPFLYTSLALCVVEIVGLIVINRVPGARHRSSVPNQAFVNLVAVINLGIVVAAFVNKRAGDWRYGAFLGVGAAVVAVLSTLAVGAAEPSRP